MTCPANPPCCSDAAAPEARRRSQYPHLERAATVQVRIKAGRSWKSNSNRSIQCIRYWGTSDTRLGFKYEKYRTEFADAAGGTVTFDETPIGNFLELEGSGAWIDEMADAWASAGQITSLRVTEASTFRTVQKRACNH